MDRKKVAFFSQPLLVGGIEKVLLTILKQIPKEEFEVTLFLPYPQDWDVAIPNGVRVVYIFRRRWNVKTLRRACSAFLLLPNSIVRVIMWLLRIQSEFDTVIAFTEWLQPAVAALRGRKLAWVHVIGPEDLAQKYFKKRLVTALRRKTWQRFDKIFCVSQATKAEFDKIAHCEGRSQALLNPIDADLIREQASLFTVPKAHDVFRYVACGRLTYQKGFDLLIEAFAGLDHSSSNLELMIVGDGEDAAMLRGLAERLRIGDKIHFCGRQDNPYPYIASADAFVCSSRFEGYGLVVAEALALGRPVLSTRCSGPEELLEFGRRGLLVDATVASLCRGLMQIREYTVESFVDESALVPIDKIDYNSIF